MFAKRKMGESWKNFVGVVLLSIFALFITACQLGLGSAVDVEPPEIEIAAPVANDIIYEKFIMSGTWADDRNEISEISIQLENTTTKQKFGPYSVPEENFKNFKWSYEINPLAENEKIPDGKYNATVTCLDREKHMTVATVAFTLDNTPPLVVLARPSTKFDATSPDGYGCEFSLEGEAVDDNVITLVEVNVFDAETKELKTTVQLENVSKKIDRTVAVFGAEDKAYEAIYGVCEELEKATQKRFYCEIVAYDEARRIPAVEGDKGNRSTCFYLESEVSKFIKQYKSAGFYEILKGSYTSDESRSAEEGLSVADAQKAIAENKIDKASFSLDPRNNPRYTVSSRSNMNEMNGTLDNENAKLINNSTVTVNFLSGLDEYYIIKDTIGVSLLQCNEKGVPVENAKEIVLFAPFKEGDDAAARENKIKTTGSTYSVDVTIGSKYQSELAVGNYYIFRVSGSDENGKKVWNYANTDYGFRLVSANAKPELSITKLQKINGTNVTDSQSVSSVDLCAGESLKILGTASLEERAPDIKFTLGLATSLSGDETVLGTIKADEFESTGYSVSIPDEYKNKKFVIRVIAINPEEPDQIASERISVTYDCEGPTIGTVTISPTVTRVESGTEKSYVNGTVNLKASVNDAMSVVDKLEYSVSMAGAAESARVLIEDLSGKGFNIDTTAWDNDEGVGTIIVKIYATDGAGNVSMRTEVLNIDQKTDAPVIEFSTVDPSITNLAQVMAAGNQNKISNIFQVNGANNYIGGTVTDDDGVASVSIFKRPHGNGSFEETVLLENGKSTAYTFKNVVAKSQGEYDVYIIVKDTAGESTGYNMTTCPEFFVGVDEGSPNFMITTTQGLQAQNTELAITGTVMDGTDVTINRYVYRATTDYDSSKRYFVFTGETYEETDSSSWTTVPLDKTYYVRVLDPYTEGPTGAETYKFATINIPKGNTTWTDRIPAGEIGSVGDMLYYEAVDSYGQKTGQNFVYTIDSYPPKFKISKVNSQFDSELSGAVPVGSRKERFVKATAGTYLTIEGTAEDQFSNDATKSRGLDQYAYYKIVAEDSIDASSKFNEANLVNGAFDISGWSTTKPIDSGIWKQTIDLEELGLEDGKKYILFMAVKDAAGNISRAGENPCSAVYIIPDRTAPVIADAKYFIGNEEKSSVHINGSNKDEFIYLKVNIEDITSGTTPSGIDTVKILENNVDYAGTTKEITKSGNQYTIKLKAKTADGEIELDTGAHILTVRATDKVGNYTDFTFEEIGVDVTSPTKPIVTSVTPFVNGENDSIKYNGKIKANISATDETGLSKLFWWIEDSTGTKVKEVTLTSADGIQGTVISKTIEINTDELTTESGDFKLYIQTEDSGENLSVVSDPYDLSVDQSTDLPKIELKNANASITTIANMKAAVEAGNIDNIFGSVTNNFIEFLVTDDDGIEEIIISKNGTPGSNIITEADIVDGKKPKIKTVRYTLPSAKEQYTIKIDVKDIKGETTNYKENSTGTFIVAVDDEKPKITNLVVTGAKQNGDVYYATENFTIDFKVQDDYKLNSLTYKENAETLQNVAVEANNVQQSKSISISKRGNTGDVTKITNIIRVEDVFGRFDEKKITYVFDLKTPVFGVLNYSLINPDAQGIGFIDSTKVFKVTGSVTDNGTDESGVDSVKFAVAKGHVDTFPANADDIKINWDDVTGAASDWTARVEAGSLDDGKYTLFVKAKDFAGNEKFANPVKFKADANKPEIAAYYFDVTGSDESVVETAKEFKSGEEELTNKTVTRIKASKLKFKFKVSDSLELDGTTPYTLAVKKTKNGATSTLVRDTNYTLEADAANSSGAQIYTVSISSAEDAEYCYEITAKDSMGKVHSVKKYILLDTVGPEINVLNPSLEEEGSSNFVWQNKNALRVSGSVSDASGIEHVYYKEEKILTAPESFSGWEDLGNSTSWKKDINVPDGTKDITLIAVDTNGTKSEVYNYTLRVDSEAPVISEPKLQRGDVAIESAESIDNHSSCYANHDDTKVESEGHKFTLSGSVEDNLKLKNFTLKAKKGEVEKTLELNKTQAVSGSDKKWNWTCTVDCKDSTAANYLENGDWKFIIDVTEEAEIHESSFDFNIFIDTVLPDLSSPLFTPEATAGSDGWYNKSKITIKPNASDSGSKLDSVERFNDREGTVTGEDSLKALGDEKWETISNTSKGYSFDDGINRIYLRAKDKAGNISYYSTGYTAKIDTQSDDVTITTPLSTAIINGKSDISFAASVNLNGESGFNKIEIHKNSYTGTLIATTDSSAIIGNIALLTYNSVAKTVSGTIKKEWVSASDTKFGIFVVFTDKAGNEGKASMNIVVDTTPPASMFTSHTGGETVYKTVSFTGRSSDVNNITSTKLQYKNTSDEWTDYTTIKDGSTNSSWIFEFDTFNAESRTSEVKVEDRYTLSTIKDNDTATPGIQAEFRIESTDEAGNTGTSDVITVTINQDADRPVISFVNLDKSDFKTVIGGKSVTFTVIDNDGVSQVKVNGTVLTAVNGQYTFTPAGSVTEADNVEMSFEIKDSKTFSTTNPKEYGRPYVVYKDSDLNDAGEKVREDNSSVIKYKYDETKPVISKVEIGYGESAASAKSMAENASEAVELEDDSDKIVGGKTRRFVVIKLTANDLNKVKSASGEISKTTLEKIPLAFTREDSTATLANQIFYSNPIQLSSDDLEDTLNNYVSGNLNIKFTVTDNSGLVSETSECSNQKNRIVIDNDGPVLASNFTAPTSEASASPLRPSISWSDSKSLVKKIRALVLDDEYFSAYNVIDVEAVKAALVTEGSGYEESTNVAFEFETSKLPTQAVLDTSYTKVLHDAQSIYSVPVYFYMEDELGNVSYDVREFLFNPYGNRPKTKVTYPAGTEAKRASLNGSIRITGTSEKGSETGNNPTDVYLQFDMNGDGNFDVTDRDILRLEEFKNLGYEVITSDVIAAEGLKVATKALPAGEYDYTALKTTNDGTSSDFWGVKVSGAESWYITVNQNLELQNENTMDSEDSSKFNFAVRAVGRAGNTFGSYSDPQFIQLDTNLPVIGKDTSYVTPAHDSVTKRTYVQDMFIKGTSYLHVTVSDSDTTVAEGGNGIKKVMVYRAKTSEGLLKNGTFAAGQADIWTIEFNASNSGTSVKGSGTAYWKRKSWAANALTGTAASYGYELDIPLTDLTSDTMFVKVVAYKANDNNTYREYNVNFDNTAPTIQNFTLNSVKYDDSEKRIVDSNGRFTLGGQMEDAGSGYDKVAFYYYRGDIKNYKRRVYDPMNPKGSKTAGVYANETAVVDHNGTSLKSGIVAMTADGTEVKTVDASGATVVYKDSDGNAINSPVMYGVKATVNITAGGMSMENVPANKNIRSGGLAYVAGSYITLGEKSGTTFALNTQSAVEGSVEVFFPYMQVVDNTGAEKTAEDGLTLTSGDDGDGMPESIVKSQTKWAWDATFDSHNIPDGPGAMVVFVWDKAGNVSSEIYDCSVQNNAPRVAKLYLGTNLNGSTSGGKPTFSDDELVSYNVLNHEGGEQGAYVLSTKEYRGTSFRVKDGLAVIPEFVGGNKDSGDSDIKMILNRDASSETRISKNTLATGNYIKNASGANTSKKLFVSDDAIMLSDAKTNLNNNKNKTTNNMAYFYVDNKNVGAESSDAEVNSGTGMRAMSFTFWDSTEDTTQGTDSCYCYIKVSDLIVDVVDTTPPVVKINPFYWNSKNDSSVPLDDNEMPLGHIDFEATPTLTSRPGVSGQVYIEGTAYDNTRLKKIYIKAPDGTEKQVAEYNGTWSEVKTGWPANWKKFEVLQDYGITQDGHTIDWRFEIDMTPYGVANNKTIDGKAYDSADYDSSYETVQTRAKTSVSDLRTAHYIMDFVPYIKGITGANRSRLGRYPVQAGAKVTLEVMNAKTNDNVSVKFYKTGADGKQGGITNSSTQNVRASAGGLVEITVPEYSCFVEVTVNSVSTQNNTNQNTKWNIEEGDWKKGDLKKGANYWNDDRYLSVWSNKTLSSSVNPWDGTVRKIKTADLKRGEFYVNKSGNSVDKADNSLDTWFGAYSSPNMMIYDEMGNGAMSYHRTLFTNSEAAFVTPVETMDMTIIGGIPWYVFNDNYVGGNSANSWGAGLMIAREGYSFPKSALNGTNSINVSENLNIVERQGNNQPSASRNPSSGYDSVLGQFKNPRITGWWDSEAISMNNGNGFQSYDGTNYIYVSYYDSFAHCLKYAAFSEHWDKSDGRGEKWGNVNGTKNFKSLARASDNMTAPTTVVAGVDRLYTASDFSSANGEDCGEWSDIMVDPSDHKPVIIYYNKTKGTLEVAHGKRATPSTANYKDADGAFSDTTEGSTGWTKTKSITPKSGNDFGRYVSAEIDENGNIHASAQDFTTGALYYVFLKKNAGNTYTATYHCIDSEVSAATWTDIQLGNNSSTNTEWYQYQPVISYINQAKKSPKVAYVDSSKNDGVTDYFFEAMPDANVYEANEMKTSVMTDVYETTTSGKKSKIGVAFNSNMLAVDFLREEQ